MQQFLRHLTAKSVGNNFSKDFANKNNMICKDMLAITSQKVLRRLHKLTLCEQGVSSWEHMTFWTSIFAVYS